MNQVKKNFIYNVLYQFLLLFLPFITVPYVSRVLGSSGIGVYSYTYSIVNYFMLIAMLGINNYGNRTIAKSRDNKDELSKNFFSIYFIQLFMSILMIFMYILYVLFVNDKYNFISWVQIIYLISNMFDINWFFFGLEKFKITVMRSTFVKIISLVLIFSFVKSSDDLWIYTLILSLSTLISQLILISYLKKEIKLVKIKKDDIFIHIKPILILFIPVISISLYKIMDKIMLGNMTVINEVGYYEQAEKIINIPLGIITALGTVMLPRISNLISRGQQKQVYAYIEKSINFMMFLAFPICLGLISISHEFIPLFLGDDFYKTSILLNYLSITIIFISFANVIRKQWLMPKEMDKEYTISVIIGAVLNLLINILLIPKYKSVGACVGTIVAEFVVMLYQIIIVWKDLPIKKYIVNSISFLIKSILMFLIISFYSYINISSEIVVLLKIVSAVIIYALLNFNYIKDILNLKKRRVKNET